MRFTDNAPVLRKINMRQDWDSYFFEIARVVSTRATCSRASVGAVIVRDKRILSTGYNGALSGERHCKHEIWHDFDGDKISDTTTVGGKPSCCLAVHAEANAITDCARRGIACDGATIYINMAPCNNCLNLIHSAGIIEIKVSG
jgi:dCMP deaminase